MCCDSFNPLKIVGIHASKEFASQRILRLKFWQRTSEQFGFDGDESEYNSIFMALTMPMEWIMHYQKRNSSFLKLASDLKESERIEKKRKKNVGFESIFFFCFCNAKDK